MQTESADQGSDFDNLAGNVHQLVSAADENLNKIKDHLSFSGASVEGRLVALEEAVAELKAQTLELQLSASDIDLLHSPKNLAEGSSPPYGQAEMQAALSRGFDVEKLDATDLPLTNSSLSEGSNVGRSNVGSLQTVVPSSPGKRKGSVHVREVDTKIAQLSRRLKTQLKQDRVKIDEFESKLNSLADYVTKLRATVSCDEAAVITTSSYIIIFIIIIIIELS